MGMAYTYLLKGEEMERKLQYLFLFEQRKGGVEQSQDQQRSGM